MCGACPPVWLMRKKRVLISMFVLHTVHVGNFQNEIFNVLKNGSIVLYRGLEKAKSHDLGIHKVKTT